MERLHIHENGRTLVQGRNSPFFWLGDTAWELFHKLNREDAVEYLDTRARQGFTVIQAVLLAELDGVRTPNAYGRYPLESFAPDEIIPDQTGPYSYWDHVDFIVEEAEKRGMYLALLPTWGDKWNLMWGQGPEFFTPENAFSYGRWVGRHFSRFPNILYILGGDRPVSCMRHRTIMEEMAKGLRDGDSEILISYHPMGPGNSLENVGDADWIDFHMLQTGHFSDRDTYRMMEKVYQQTEAHPKPVIDGEFHYEGMACDFCPQNPRFTQRDIRRGAYWSVFSGGFGITYGAASVWCMQTEETRSELYPLTWRESLAMPGASQLSFLKELILSRDVFSRKPCQSVLRWPMSWDSHLTACAGDRYLLVYDPNGEQIFLRSDAVPFPLRRMTWFSPETGKTMGESSIPETLSFLPPETGKGKDWVLILE